MSKENSMYFSRKSFPDPGITHPDPKPSFKASGLLSKFYLQQNPNPTLVKKLRSEWNRPRLFFFRNSKSIKIEIYCNFGSMLMELKFRL